MWRDRRLTWADITERTRRLANLLLAHGLGATPVRRPSNRGSRRRTISRSTSPTATSTSRACSARTRRASRRSTSTTGTSPTSSPTCCATLATRAVVYHARYAPLLADVLPQLDAEPVLLLQVDDESGNDLLPGALAYEEALAAQRPRPASCGTEPRRPVHRLHGRDHWHAEGHAVAAGRLPRRRPSVSSRRDGTDFESIDEIVELARRRELRSCPAPPLMHGAAHWNAISTWTAAARSSCRTTPSTSTLPTSSVPSSANASGSLNIVGDAFARPLLEELRAGALRRVARSGTSSVAAPSLSQLDQARVDRARAGPAHRRHRRARPSPDGRESEHRDDARARSNRRPTACVLSDDRTRRLAPGDPRVGWLAQTGRMPRGYLGDRDEDRADVPDDRRRSLRRRRRPRPAARRRPHRVARPRVGDDQHRRREGLRGRSRARAQAPSRRVRRARRRAAERARGAKRSWPSCACATALTDVADA